MLKLFFELNLIEMIRYSLLVLIQGSNQQEEEKSSSCENLSETTNQKVCKEQIILFQFRNYAQQLYWPIWKVDSMFDMRLWVRVTLTLTLA